MHFDQASAYGVQIYGRGDCCKIAFSFSVYYTLECSFDQALGYVA